MPLRAALALALTVSLFALCPTTRAGATECRALAGGSPALAGIDAETRLRWLDYRLGREAHRLRIWSGLWGAAYGGVVIVESSLAIGEKIPDQRAEDIVGASASFIGVLSVLILPPSLERDESWWSRHHREAPAGTDPCALLATAEHLLERGAASEEFGIGPLVHVGNFVINIAAGLVLGLGYSHWGAFAYTGLVGIGVGEIQVITQPTGAIEDLRNYKNGDLTASGHASRLQWGLVPYASRDGGGASFAVRF